MWKGAEEREIISGIAEAYFKKNDMNYILQKKETYVSTDQEGIVMSESTESGQNIHVFTEVQIQIPFSFQGSDWGCSSLFIPYIQFWHIFRNYLWWIFYNYFFHLSQFFPLVSLRAFFWAILLFSHIILKVYSIAEKRYTA